MTDIATGFIQGIEAFLTTRLGEMTQGAWEDSTSLIRSLADQDMQGAESAFNDLKTNIEAMSPLVQDLVKKIDRQTTVISTMVSESVADVESDDFHLDVAARVAVRIATALGAADEAYRIIATELAKDANGVVDEALRDRLLGLWNPWVQPFINMGTTGSNLLNQFGQLLGFSNLSEELASRITLERSGGFRLVAKTIEIPATSLGALTLEKTSVEAFLQFSDREVVNPTEEEKASLIQRGEKFYHADLAILGVRVRTTLEPGITNNDLLKKIMPGAKEPKASTVTAISLDTADGLYLGEDRAKDKMVIPIPMAFPGVELREMVLGLVRNAQREVTALEVTTSIAAELENVVGLLIEGSGVIITLEGPTSNAAMFDLPVALRWPDRIGLKIDAAVVTGAGYIERIERTYKDGEVETKQFEFGGVIQLKILNFGVSALVILSPDPFSLVLILGTRFPTAIDLGFGFTLNGIGGILALERGLSIPALQAALKDHIVDRMLMPDDPSIDGAPKLLEQVAQIFPPRDGGFVVGPAAELGWGSQAKFVTVKVAVVLALPDTSVTILGALRIQAPTKEAALTDIRADLFTTIDAARLLLFASMRDSKIGPIKIKGDLGLLIEWDGEGAFELSIGGFHPSYEKLTGKPSRLGPMERITIDLSPASFLKAVVKAYFAITAGTVQFGVEGTLKADFKVISASAWLNLDAIFMWSPHFAFEANFRVGASVEFLGASLAGIDFSGTLSGMQPFELSGRIKVDVWFLPTFDEAVGPIRWGDSRPPIPAAVDALALVVQQLEEPDAWKALLPSHATQLATLASFIPTDDSLLAHPLAGLEITQNVVPIGWKLARMGTAPLISDMVMMGAPVMTNFKADTVSETTGAFAPGHYFDLEGEQLLARGGFEEFQNGIRIGGQTTPVAGRTEDVTVSYRIFLRGTDGAAQESGWPGMLQFNHLDVSSSLAARAVEEHINPYMSTPPSKPPVNVEPMGTSVLTDSSTGAQILDSLGALSATQASVVLDALGGLTTAVRTEVRNIQ